MFHGHTVRPAACRSHNSPAIGYHFPTKGIPVTQPNKAKKTAWETKERTSTPQIGITNEKYSDSCYYATKHDVSSDVDPTEISKHFHLVQISTLERACNLHWQEKPTPARQRSPVSTTVFTRLGARDKSGFTRLGEKRIDIHSWLGPKFASRTKHASDRRHASSEMSAGVQNHGRREARNPVHSDVACSSKRQREVEEVWDAADRAVHMRHGMNEYSRKGQKESQKQTKLSTGWKRQSQSEAKVRSQPHEENAT
ncbi:hypothetical protein Tco_0735557 [Tanacetum coccineum]